MDTIQASPRNRYTGALADTLLDAKRGANQYEVKDWVPLLGGTGLGDLFMGKAPELADDVSYQGLNALYRGGNLATGGLGTYGLDPRTVDAAFLGADAYGLSKLATHLAKKGGQKLIGGATDLSRREFMKRAGALGGAAALGGVGLGALRTVGRESGEAAAKAAPKVATKHRFNSLKEYNDYLDDMISHDSETLMTRAGSGYKKELALADEAAYNAAKGTGNREVIDAFSPKAKAEMRAFKQQADEYAWADADAHAYRPSEGFTDSEMVQMHDDFLDNTNWTDYLHLLELP